VKPKYESKVSGIFESFRAEGNHIWGKLANGKEIKVTQMVRGGEGLKTTEEATRVVNDLNEREELAHILGSALQLDFDAEGIYGKLQKAA
jgi:hypothetical protein